MTRMSAGVLACVLAAAGAATASAEDADVREAYGVRWQPTLERALEAATPKEGAAKPVVWFRVLGDLDGLT